jgi:hypothetical protein
VRGGVETRIDVLKMQPKQARQALRGVEQTFIWCFLALTYGSLAYVIVAAWQEHSPGASLLAFIVTLVAFCPALAANSVRLWPWAAHPRPVRCQAFLSALYPGLVLVIGWLFIWGKNAA